MPRLSFKTKNIVIEAFQVGNDEVPDWILKRSQEIFFTGNDCFVGAEKITYGDYILQSLSGEIFTCSHKAFQKIFEMVER